MLSPIFHRLRGNLYFDETDVIPNFVPTFRDLLVLLMGPIVYPHFFTDVRDNLSLLLMGPIGYPKFITDVSEEPVSFWRDRYVISNF